MNSPRVMDTEGSSDVVTGRGPGKRTSIRAAADIAAMSWATTEWRARGQRIVPTVQRAAVTWFIVSVWCSTISKVRPYSVALRATGMSEAGGTHGRVEHCSTDI